ncbi:MAG TPA: Tad domain-containing protein [Methylomirabilota bacterium]|nr:Tad domain-containing protein [Methylomirabilota bacterium]
MSADLRADEGQALVVVALAMVVLVGALALAVDWGYGYTTRRAIQNTADSVTLAAARHVASTFTTAGDFDATLEDICDDVRTRTTQIGGSVQVSFFSEATAADPALWTTISTTSCSSGHSVPVPADTVFVRVHASKTYTSLFKIVTSQPLTVAASSRARLTGAAGCPDSDCAGLRPLHLPQSEVPGTGISGETTTPNVAMWPLAIHLELSDFSGSPCGQYCDTGSRSPITLWPKDSYGTSGSRFRGLVTFTHFSPREAPDQVHQLSTESDYTGTNTAVSTAHNHAFTPNMPNADSRACGAATSWDTLGAPTLASTASCDLPNWFAYGFRGSVGVGTDWSDPSWDGFEQSPGTVDPPDPLGARAACDRAIFLPRPSCSNPAFGDWIETVPGDLDRVMADQMLAFVRQYGRVVPNSGSLGKAAVVHIMVWDCAEHFDPSQPTGSTTRWDIITKTRGGDSDDDDDCSKLKRSDTRSTTVDRVHIIAAVPFTIYEGLINPSAPRVQGYWGDIFGDAGICSQSPIPAGCDLNPVMNSAFLVPDE